jgi:hypothetical protein
MERREARIAAGGRRPIVILATALSILARKVKREGVPIARHSSEGFRRRPLPEPRQKNQNPSS